MAYGDLRRCPRCGKLAIEDDHMREDVSVCPFCGASYDNGPAEQGSEEPGIVGV